MEEFIQSITGKLGVDESVARNATGKALGFLKGSMGDSFDSIAEKIPGVNQMVDSADADDSEEADSGGMFGGITKAASSMLGGSAGEGLDLMGSLKKLGLSTEQGGSLVSKLLEFIKEKVGSSTVDKILEKVPFLKSIL